MRKVQMLLRAHAEIRLIAPQILPELQQLLTANVHEVAQRNFAASDLKDIKLVIAATDSPQVNREVFVVYSALVIQWQVLK